MQSGCRMSSFRILVPNAGTKSRTYRGISARRVGLEIEGSRTWESPTWESRGLGGGNARGLGGEGGGVRDLHLSHESRRGHDGFHILHTALSTPSSQTLDPCRLTLPETHFTLCPILTDSRPRRQLADDYEQLPGGPHFEGRLVDQLVPGPLGVPAGGVLGAIGGFQ